MANTRESKLKIIRDIVDIDVPPDVRIARVASPLLSLEAIKIEAAKFINEHDPDRLTCKDTVELKDTKGNTIGGAMIWEASWQKDPTSQEVWAVRRVFRKEFEREQDKGLIFPTN